MPLSVERGSFFPTVMHTKVEWRCQEGMRLQKERGATMSDMSLKLGSYFWWNFTNE